MQILSTLVSTLNILFLSKDLNLLFSSPLPIGKIFLWKGIEVAFNSSIMVVFFSLPILFAYCHFFASNVLQITAVVISFSLYIISGVLIGLLIGILIPSFFSIKKLQPILTIISIIFISLIIIFLRLLRPEQFGNPEVISNLMSYMSGLEVREFVCFPFYWAAKCLNAVASGNQSDYFLFSGFFVILTILLVIALWILQKKYYFNLFNKLLKSSTIKGLSSWKKKIIRGDYGTLWKKEIKTFFRTPSQWSQLLIIGAIIIVFVINMKEIPMPHPTIKVFISYLNLGMAAFIVAGLNSRFTFTTFPMEIPGIVHIMASPFKQIRVLNFKLLFFGIPQLIIGFILFFITGIILDLDPYMQICGVIFLSPALVFLTVIAIYFSLKIQSSKPLSPQHLIASRPGIMYMLWSLVYIILGQIYFIRPTYLYYINSQLSRPVPYLEIILWFSGYVIINLVLIYHFLKRSRRLWLKKEFI